ncbi:MAG: hypothetical protein LKJ25_00640 [Clostridia bacterium]|nr:hypothetical protein [Clostridia bacterium]
MKKFRTFLISAIVFCVSLPCFSVYAFAAENNIGFGITGGIDTTKDSIVTFDDTRTISGKANNGTDIDISVYTKSFAGNYKEKYNYKLNVGLSGLFSQTVSLNIGENLICINAEKDGETAGEEVTVKRKADEIKNKLENGIYLP